MCGWPPLTLSDLLATYACESHDWILENQPKCHTWLNSFDGPAIAMLVHYPYIVAYQA